jgi:hypothetical protein
MSDGGGVQGPFPGPDVIALRVEMARLDRECRAHAELLLAQAAKVSTAEADRDRLAREVAILEGRLRSHEVGLGQVQEERDRLKRDLADAVAVRNQRWQMAKDAHSAQGRLRAENETLRKLVDAPPYVDCICPGCPRKVPQAWASGMCETCAVEDCEHTDGARGVAAERDQLAVLNDNQAETIRRLEDESNDARRLREVMVNAMAYVVAQRDRLRVVVADTPENVEAMAKALARACEEGPWREGDTVTWDNDCMVAAALLADQRARAGITDLEAAGVNHDQRDVGAQAQPAGAAAAPTGQAGGALSGSAGPPGGPVGPQHPMCRSVVVNVDPAVPGADRSVEALGALCSDGPLEPLPPDRAVMGIEVGPEGERPRAYMHVTEALPLREWIPTATLAKSCAMHVVGGNPPRELLRVPKGVTPADLRAQGFPDVAAALERGPGGEATT